MINFNGQEIRKPGVYAKMVVGDVKQNVLPSANKTVLVCNSSTGLEFGESSPIAYFSNTELSAIREIYGKNSDVTKAAERFFRNGHTVGIYNIILRSNSRVSTNQR